MRQSNARRAPGPADGGPPFRGLAVATFAYHEVTDEPSDSGFQRAGALPYKLATREFARHLQLLARGPVAPTLVADIDFTAPGRHLLLTFDDGGKSACRAADALSERGWRGHFFVVTSLIGRRTFLTDGEIRQIRRGGHLVGSHTHTHPDIFREESPDRMLAEWRASCDRLAQILGEPCLAASVPGGDISAAVLRSADAAGLRFLFTSEPWLTPRQVGQCYVLGRFCPKAGISASRVRGLASFRGWRRELLSRQFKVLARRAAPPLYRAYVRRSTLPPREEDGGTQ